MAKSDRDLTQGRTDAVLFKMSWPMMIGILASMSVSLFDAYFLGQLGTKPLTAISFCFPVVLTLMSLAIGLGAGTSSVVSRAIGQGHSEKTQRVSTAALILCVLVTSLIGIIGFFTIRPLFSLLGASGETLDMVQIYMRIWYIGLPALAVMMVASNLLRANGDSRTPAIMMVVIAVLNVCLNAVLIPGFGPIPEMGIAGAGWASLIARFATLIVALWLIAFREKLVGFADMTMQKTAHAWREVGTVAIPAAIGNAVNPLGITIVTGFMANFGDAAVAAFGTATRVESFISIPMLAMSAAIGPIAGQNFGKGDIGRVRKTLVQSYSFSIFWSVILGVALWLSGSLIMGIFSSDQAVVDKGALYLAIVPISLAGYGITVVASGAFNAIGKPVIGLGFYLIRTAIFYVPLAWIASVYFAQNSLFFAIAISNILAGLIIAALSIWMIGQLKAKQTD